MSEGRVLVAESDPRLAGVLRWLLAERGYSAEVVSGATAVPPQLDRGVPDAVVLDWDGAAAEGVVARLRADDRFRDVRLIAAMSGAHSDGSFPVAVGADDWVMKPYRPGELIARLDAQLRTRAELIAAREAVASVLDELQRARDTSADSQQLIDILHDVTGELSAAEIYRVLTRRVARALAITHCSVVLVRTGETVGTIAAALEDSSLTGLEITLAESPEIGAALESETAVLIEDWGADPSIDRAHRHPDHDMREGALRSLIALPFTIDRWRSGVLLIKTRRDERGLTNEDVEFAELVLRAAVTAIRRAQALETTRADNVRLEALATTDPLTRVLNRRALMDRLSTEVDRARRFKSTLTLLLIDVDYFKLINDTAGHLAGDDVLRQLAALLEDAVRRVDIVARYGGEEFVLILPETTFDGGLVFAERLRERVAAQTFEIGAPRPLHLTVSIGVATFPSERVESMEDLFARGDEALYRAKSSGRNLVRI